MTARKNPFVKIGRPRSVGKPATDPTSTLVRQVPGRAFRSGGSVAGYRTMPKYHDSPSMGDFRRKDC